MDTNCNPEEIDYPVPANDDAIRAIRLICTKIADAILEARTMETPTGEDGEAVVGELEAIESGEPLIFTPDDE